MPRKSPAKRTRPASAVARSERPLAMGVRSRSRPIRAPAVDPEDARRVVRVTYEPPPEHAVRASPLERRIDEAWGRIGGLGASGRNRRRLIDNPSEHEVAWNGTTKRAVRVSLRDSELQDMARRAADADPRFREGMDLTDELVEDMDCEQEAPTTRA